jgi:hypothetical protein
MTTTPETIAAHHLGYDANNDIVSSGTNFEAATYSRMKYGDRAATLSLADDLSEALAAEQPHLIEGETAPEFLVAYKAVPPACYYLSRYCLDKLNITRNEQGLEPGRLIHVYKSRVAATNYAAASQAERQKELDDIGFSLEGRDITNVPVAVLDDIRITGAAEKKMIEVISPKRPSHLTLGYIALFDAAQAAASPHVENDLNISVVKSVIDLIPAVQNDNFDLNIRTLKLILAANPEDLEKFLDACPENLTRDIYRGTIATGPDFVRQYSAGQQILADKATKWSER